MGGDQRHGRFGAEVHIGLVDHDHRVGQGLQQALDLGARDAAAGRRVRVGEDHATRVVRPRRRDQRIDLQPQTGHRWRDTWWRLWSGQLAADVEFFHDQGGLMRTRDSMPLFDTERFVRNLELAYHEMWQRWIA